MTRVLMLGALVLVGCKKDDPGKKSSDTDPQTSRFDEFIYVTQEAKGDFSGWNGADSFEDADWLTQDKPDNTGAPIPSLMEVTDFQEGDAVPNARVQVWYSNLANDGTADHDLTTDSSGGALSLDLPACDPFTYLVTTDASLDETKPTYKAHHVMNYEDDGTLNDEFQSVSTTTFKLIPALLGVTVDPDKSIIAGALYDRDPSGEETVTNGQVVVYVDGEIPDSLVVNYMRDEFPARDQEWTSADGLWVASNVPAGEVRVEAWGVLKGEMTLLGASQVVSEKDSINIASIFTGLPDGIFYPETCYQ